MTFYDAVDGFNGNPEPRSKNVYVTRTGNVQHRTKNCTALAKSNFMDVYSLREEFAVRIGATSKCRRCNVASKKEN